MQSTNLIVTTLLPLSLAIIMFGLGLSLTVKDFTRVILYPKSIILGLICQMLLLPAIALIVCKTFDLTPVQSLGVMILAASPGGITANLYSHLSHGDIALNLTLTAINSVLAAFSLPLIVNLSASYFSQGGESIGLQFAKTMEVFAIVLIPVAIGMLVNHNKPAFSKKAEKPVKIFSFIVLIGLIVSAILQQKDQLLASFSQVGGAIIVFNLASLAIGYILPMMLKVSRAESIAIAMEVGIHNGTLAIYVALTLLKSFELALPAALYSIVMFFTAGIFSLILLRKHKAKG